jgi:hypothetical protein
LRRAFFYAPREGDPAAMILSDEADLAPLHRDQCADARATSERVAASHHLWPGERVNFPRYDEVDAMLAVEVERASTPT